MFTPFHLRWLQRTYPDLSIRIIVTDAAARFVQPAALQLLSGGPVYRDNWQEWGAANSVHVELALWADAVIINPASFNYMNEYAAGLGSRPSLLTLHMTTAPKIFSPSVPPGIDPQPWLERLRNIPRTYVSDFARAESQGTGRLEETASIPLVASMTLLEEILEKEDTHD